MNAALALSATSIPAEPQQWWWVALDIVSKLGPIATVAGVLWAVISYRGTNKAKAVQSAARVICQRVDSGVMITNLSDEVITNIVITQEGASTSHTPRQDFIKAGGDITVPGLNPQLPIVVKFWGPHGWWWQVEPGVKRPVRIRP